jgi:hypothetical protein
MEDSESKMECAQTFRTAVPTGLSSPFSGFFASIFLIQKTKKTQTPWHSISIQIAILDTGDKKARHPAGF